MNNPEVLLKASRHFTEHFGIRVSKKWKDEREYLERCGIDTTSILRAAMSEAIENVKKQALEAGIIKERN